MILHLNRIYIIHKEYTSENLKNARSVYDIREGSSYGGFLQSQKPCTSPQQRWHSPLSVSYVGQSYVFAIMLGAEMYINFNWHANE